MRAPAQAQPRADPAMNSAEIARQEFLRRRAWLVREYGEGRIALDEAEARLRPWLHAAAMIGAQLDLCVDHHVVIYPWARAGEAMRIPLALSLSPDQRNEARFAVARARDAAVCYAEAASGEERARLIPPARALALLAHDLCAPPFGHPSLAAPATAQGLAA